MCVLLCVLYGVSLCWYIRRSLREGFAPQLVLKTVTSTLFVLIAWVCFIRSAGNTAYFVPMLLALIFSLVGDVFIQLQRRETAFTRYALACGVAAFFTAHCLFATAFMRVAPFSIADLAVSCVLFTAVYLVFRRLRLNFGRVAPMCMLYLAAIVFMFTKALSVWYMGGTSILAIMLTAGGALFVASDFMLTLKSFHPPCKHNAAMSAAVTLTYYLAQLLFALSIFFT